MGNKYKYIFDDATGILYKYYYGPITLKDISSSWDTAIEQNLIPHNTKGFILDYRKATFNIELDEYSKIADYYKQHLNIFGNHKIAIVTQTVQDLAIPTLVKVKDSGYSSCPFTNVEAAVRWVLS